MLPIKDSTMKMRIYMLLNVSHIVLIISHLRTQLKRCFAEYYKAVHLITVLNLVKLI